MTKIVDVLLDEIKSRGYTIARFSREAGIQNWLKSGSKDKDAIQAHSALLSVIVSELASVISRETGEHPAAITKRLYKAAEDVGKIDG